MAVSLYCPFPSRIHAQAERADTESLAWCRARGLLGSATLERKFETQRFALLAARMFPRAPDPVLRFAANFSNWLFVLDDMFDEQEMGRAPARLSAWTNLLSLTFRSQHPALAEPVFGALAELSASLTQLTGPHPGLWSRFGLRLHEYFEGCCWEATNRACGIAPSLDTFLILRKNAGAVFTYLDLTELATGVYLSLEARKHPRIERMNLAACNVACWSNDIYSFEKEREQSDWHNLVLLERRERNLTLAEALTSAVRACDDEVRHFERLAQEPPRLANLDETHAAQAYVDGLRDYIRGALDWTAACPRYA